MTTEETATAEAPKQKDPATETETERDQILKALAEHDRSVSGEDREPQSESSKPSGDLAPDETETKPEETATEQKKTRQEKEDERKERSWARIQEEREAAKRDREDAKRDREESDKAKAETEAFIEEQLRKLREARQEAEFTPEHYEDAAERFEDDGNDEMAAKARRRAVELRSELQAEKAELARFKAEQQWKANMDELAKDQPDLMKEGTELNTTVREVLQVIPQFQQDPNGINHAVRAANILIENKQLKDVQALNDELQAKVKMLEQKLHPGGATPLPLEPGGDVSQMDEAQQREYFRSKFAQHDASRPQMTT